VRGYLLVYGVHILFFVSFAAIFDAIFDGSHGERSKSVGGGASFVLV
jgi:hypothetical protein